MLIISFSTHFFTFFMLHCNFVANKSTIFAAQILRKYRPLTEADFTKLMEMFKTLLFTLLIIAISFALLAITIIIKKNGKFPNLHVGGNKAMRKRGIKCVQSQDKDARIENPMAVKEINTVYKKL